MFEFVSLLIFQGASFWRSNRKILVAKKEEMQFRQGKKRERKSSFLHQLKRLINDSEPEEVEVAKIPTTVHQRVPAVEEEARRMLKSIFKCVICLNECNLPAAACGACYAVIGCIPCIEQWLASNTSGTNCPLCRTTANYATIPIITDIANIIGQVIPRYPNASEGGEEGSHSDDTIPYIATDEENQSSDEELLRPAF